MAMQTLRVRVCDVCGGETATARYKVQRVTPNPRTITVDLCEDHADGMDRAFEVRPVAHRRTRKVTSVGEVKKVAKKTAAARKAAAKKSSSRRG